jgi:hypothetical protein
VRGGGGGAEDDVNGAPLRLELEWVSRPRQGGKTEVDEVKQQGGGGGGAAGIAGMAAEGRGGAGGAIPGAAAGSRGDPIRVGDVVRVKGWPSSGGHAWLRGHTTSKYLTWSETRRDASDRFVVLGAGLGGVRGGQGDRVVLGDVVLSGEHYQVRRYDGGLRTDSMVVAYVFVMAFVHVLYTCLCTCCVLCYFY